MPYVDLAGLSRYASRQKDRLEREYALLRDMQWLRTEKAGAVSLWPAGGTPLKPSVDFLFSETPPASGDKGPENSSTITGVSSVKVTRCGKNLIKQPYDYASGYTKNGLTFTINNDGSVLITGTASALTGFRFATNMFLPSGTYALSGCPSDGGNSTYTLIIQSNTTSTINYTDYGNGVSFTLLSDYYNIYISVKNGFNPGTAGVVFPAPQLELGSAATAFEPYEGADYTLPLGSTFYGGTLDVASGVMTVTYRYFEVDPDVVTVSCNVDYEAINTSACYLFPSLQRAAPRACAWSNRFITDATIGNLLTDVEMIYTGSGASSILLRISKARLGPSYDATDATAIKSAWDAWLRANPTYIAYALADPFTVQLDPVSISALVQSDKYTPRLNTIYTDAQSVQVGYVKSPIRDEYELQQAVIAQGGNV